MDAPIVCTPGGFGHQVYEWIEHGMAVLTVQRGRFKEEVLEMLIASPCSMHSGHTSWELGQGSGGPLTRGFPKLPHNSFKTACSLTGWVLEQPVSWVLVGC